MSNGVIEITVCGSAHSGKTYIIDKIITMLKAEGIDCKVVNPDGDSAKFAEARSLGEDIPTLKEVLDSNGVNLIIQEKMRA